MNKLIFNALLLRIGTEFASQVFSVSFEITLSHLSSAMLFDIPHSQFGFFLLPLDQTSRF